MLKIFKKDYIKVTNENWSKIQQKFLDMEKRTKELEAKEEMFEEGNREYRTMLQTEKALKNKVQDLENQIDMLKKESKYKDNYITLFIRKLKEVEEAYSIQPRKTVIIDRDYAEKTLRDIEKEFQPIYA